MEYFNRQYELTIGNTRTGKGVVITNLQIRFDITRSADNKKGSNAGSIEVINLHRDHLTILENKHIECTLKVGYVDIGIGQIFSGNVTSVKTVQQGTDFVTQLIVGEGYTTINHSKISTKVPAGKTKGDVIDTIIQSIPGASRGITAGANFNSPIVQGYVIQGTGKEALDRFARENALQWRIQNGVIDITTPTQVQANYRNTSVVLTPLTGLIESPYYTEVDNKESGNDKSKEYGLSFKCVMNHTILCGRTVFIDVGGITPIKGYFRVEHIRYSGDYFDGDWTIECIGKRV
jgi:hypothetical protein